jgi:hypothetical protein
MHDFQTNPIFFVVLVLVLTGVIGYIGAYKAFFKEPKNAPDEEESKGA